MLHEILKNSGINLQLTMLEVGAVPLTGDTVEPFHRLLEGFPGSRVIAFEVDEEVCQKLNQAAPAGIQFYAQALGRAEETRDFYVAAAPMCSSLYPPNQAYCDLFQNLGDLVRTIRKTQVTTVSLDHFARSANVVGIDFVKIDVQGAELEIFRGGERALKDVLAIVTEVEFEPIYVGQPLYEDVSTFLRGQGFAFHKFLGLAGRAVQPIVYNKNVNTPQQHLWSDAVFIRDLMRLIDLSDESLFKLALLMECYGSVDVSHFLLKEIDHRRATNFADLFMQRLLAGSRH
jgi:FkbM family methyltransferase